MRQLFPIDSYSDLEITSNANLAIRRLLVCPKRHIDMNSHLHILPLKLDIKKSVNSSNPH